MPVYLYIGRKEHGVCVCVCLHACVCVRERERERLVFSLVCLYFVWESNSDTPYRKELADRLMPVEPYIEVKEHGVWVGVYADMHAVCVCVLERETCFSVGLSIFCVEK